MSEVMVDFIISLDGYASAEGWPGWWGLEGPEYLDWLGSQPEGAYTLLMGAKTYRLMYGFAAAGQEGVDSLNSARKLVFSSTLSSPLEWENAELVTGDAVEAVRELKASGESMSTLGSLSLARSLLAAGVVDRFRVVVFPVITGRTGSERIFDGYPDVALDLIEARTFDGRLQLLDYVPRLLDAPLPPGIGSR
jgi:dihydrofolate reductase